LELTRTIIDAWKSSYAKNLSITGLGVGMGSVISFLTAPVLSRIFSPEAYGIAGLYSNILSYLAMFGGLMLPAAIVILPQPRRLYTLISGLKMLWIIGFVVTSVLVICFGSFLQQCLNDTSDGIWLWVLPLGLLISQVNEMVTALNVRGAKFATNVKVDISNSLVTRGSSLGLGLITSGHYLSLVFSSLLGIISTLGWQTRASVRRIIAIPASFGQLKRCLQDLAHYPRYLLPGNLLSVFSLTAPFLVFSVLYSPALAGVYLFADNMLLVPFRLASKAITPVYLQQISRLFRANHGQFRKLTMATNYSLFLIGLLPYALLTVWGPEIFSFVFGEAWEEGGVIAQYLAFFVLFRLSTSPLSAIYRVAEAERASFVTQIVLFLSRIIPLAIGLYWFSLHQALFFFAAGSLLGYFFHFHQLCRIGQLPFLRTILLQSLIFALLCSLLWAIKFWLIT
jgi:O-antigen/teichoic acid export membrane protein